jgi:hypothetical protein
MYFMAANAPPSPHFLVGTPPTQPPWPRCFVSWPPHHKTPFPTLLARPNNLLYAGGATKGPTCPRVFHRGPSPTPAQRQCVLAQRQNPVLWQCSQRAICVGGAAVPARRPLPSQLPNGEGGLCVCVCVCVRACVRVYLCVCVCV